MQLTNDQIKAVSEWMKEHGIDEHLIEKFEGDWMKSFDNFLVDYFEVESIEKLTPLHKKWGLQPLFIKIFLNHNLLI